MAPGRNSQSSPIAARWVARGRARWRHGRPRALAAFGALRVHFFALPAGAVLAGASSAPDPATTVPVAVAAAAAALGWGGGQLFNDLQDIAADAIDAPARAGPRGLLSPKPTMVLIGVIGIIVTLATLSVHPDAAWLAGAALVLLLVYGPCKRRPALGNLAHGALYSVATAIGAAASLPTEPLIVAVTRSLDTALLAGFWGAVYVQANYEKDRRGDAAAGCRSLAHVVGLRWSAWGRIGCAVAWGAAAPLLAPNAPRPLLWLAVALVVLSAIHTATPCSESGALRGYRYAVHGVVVGLWALAAPALAPTTLALLLGVAFALVELAFRRTANP